MERMEQEMQKRTVAMQAKMLSLHSLLLHKYSVMRANNQSTLPDSSSTSWRVCRNLKVEGATRCRAYIVPFPAARLMNVGKSPAFAARVKEDVLFRTMHEEMCLRWERWYDFVLSEPRLASHPSVTQELARASSDEFEEQGYPGQAADLCHKREGRRRTSPSRLLGMLCLASEPARWLALFWDDPDTFGMSKPLSRE